MKESEAIALLKKYAPNEKHFKAVLAHSKKVQEIALRMAAQHPTADKEFIAAAALLHDIGRFTEPRAIFHGIAGAEILKKEGFPEYAKVAERHLGAGISMEDIKEQHLPLPKRDFMPLTLEEKIIAAADNLAEDGKEISEAKAVERFRKELGEKVAAKVKALFDELKIYKQAIS